MASGKKYTQCVINTTTFAIQMEGVKVSNDGGVQIESKSFMNGNTPVINHFAKADNAFSEFTVPFEITSANSIELKAIVNATIITSAVIQLVDTISGFATQMTNARLIGNYDENLADGTLTCVFQGDPVTEVRL